MASLTLRLPGQTRRILAAAAALSLAACSGDDATASSSRADGKQFTELMAHEWTLNPGVESFHCVYQTLEEDVWVSEFNQLSPTGTHHVTLGFSDPGPPDGVISSTDANAEPPCTGITLGKNLAYFGGVGTGTLGMPEGVAVKLPAGKQLQLNVHLYNTGDAPLSGRSGVEVVTPRAEEVIHEAEVVLVENPFLNVPLGESTASGTCTMVDDVTVFALSPHMHWTGTHLKTTAIPANGPPTTLLDLDYDFEEQFYKTLDPPLALQKGDKLQVDCSYQNPGPEPLPFGESTGNEMCITFTYRYPAVAETLDCFM